MTDYWKSNPRKFCEVCKCWFGDNKASIDFHERGGRHQENVKKLLSSARQRAAENEKEALKEREMLASIEVAAAAAYVKDLEGDEGDSSTVKKSTTTKKKRLHPLPATVTPAPPVIEECFQMKKAMAHMEILHAIQERQAKSEREVARREMEAGPPPPPPSQWQQAATPEGHTYYYNIFTRETQWEQPEDFLPLPTFPQQQTSSSSTFGSTTTAASDRQGTSLLEGESERKRSLGEWEGEEEEEGEELTPAPKRVAGPYGDWTTVAIHSRQPDSGGEEGGSDGGGGGEVDSEEEGDTHRAAADDDEEDRLRFGERTVASLKDEGREGEEAGGDFAPGNFKGFGFKKRMSSGRPNIKQRTSEIS